MHSVVAFVLAAAAVSAQEIGFAEGSKVSAGSSAINNPNVNNGVQWDSSLSASGANAGNTLLNHVSDSQFTNVNENLSIQDNLVNNLGFTSVEGNSGWTADGNGNVMGPVQNDMRGVVAPLRKRAGDIVFANNHHSEIAATSLVYSPYAAQYYVPSFVSYPVSVVAPVHYRPIHKVHPGYVANAPVVEAPKYASKAPVVEVPKHDYKAPIAEEPKHEYKAPVTEEPKHEYQAPVVEAPRYESKTPPVAAEPTHVEPVQYSSSPITNVKYAKAL